MGPWQKSDENVGAQNCFATEDSLKQSNIAEMQTERTELLVLG